MRPYINIVVSVLIASTISPALAAPVALTRYGDSGISSSGQAFLTDSISLGTLRTRIALTLKHELFWGMSL